MTANRLSPMAAETCGEEGGRGKGKVAGQTGCCYADGRRGEAGGAVLRSSEARKGRVVTTLVEKMDGR